MKAEQRKELETNTLADKMGRVVQSVKGGTRKTVLLVAAVAAVVLIGSYFSYRWYILDRQEASLKWLMLYDGARGQIDGLTKLDGEAAKAARFQVAWVHYWEGGIKMFGAAQSHEAIANLKRAEKLYGELAELCKNDPIFEPQALLGQAVVKESLAVEDPVNLEKAGKLYEALIAEKEGKYKDSAEGKFAQERLKHIKDAKNEVALRETYQELRRLLNVQARIDLPKDGLPPFIKQKE